jgi:uroporphyrin-III C-methyltransferase
MGMSKLHQIVQLFQQENKNNLPVAIIQNGTRTDEKVGIGTVDTILEIVKEQELSNPAIIILGEVVNHRSIIANIQNEYAKELNV